MKASLASPVSKPRSTVTRGPTMTSGLGTVETGDADHRRTAHRAHSKPSKNRRSSNCCERLDSSDISARSLKRALPAHHRRDFCIVAAHAAVSAGLPLSAPTGCRAGVAGAWSSRTPHRYGVVETHLWSHGLLPPRRELFPVCSPSVAARERGRAESPRLTGFRLIGETGFEPATARPPAGIR